MKSNIFIINFDMFDCVRLVKLEHSTLRDISNNDSLIKDETPWKFVQENWNLDYCKKIS